MAHAAPVQTIYLKSGTWDFQSLKNVRASSQAMDATRIAASGLQAASQRFSAAASNLVTGTSLGQAAPATSDPVTDIVAVREAANDFRANLTVLKVSQQMTGQLLDMFT